MTPLTIEVATAGGRAFSLSRYAIVWIAARGAERCEVLLVTGDVVTLDEPAQSLVARLAQEE